MVTLIVQSMSSVCSYPVNQQHPGSICGCYSTHMVVVIEHKLKQLFTRQVEFYILSLASGLRLQTRIMVEEGVNPTVHLEDRSFQVNQV